MKTKRVLPLLAMLAAGSMLCLSGCSVDVTTINEEEVTIEEEVEEEDLAEGTVLFHSVWYDADGNKLPNVEVAFYEDETLAFSGTTEEDGSLESFSLPCNTTLSCSVTDEDGDLIAESDVVIKLSDNYESVAIYPTKDVVSAEEEETPTLILEIPTDNVNLRAGFYVTESRTVSLANLTAYVEEEETAGEETEEAAEEETTEEQAAEEQAAEEQAAEEQAAEEQAAEEQTAEEQAAEEQTAEEQAAEEQTAEEQAAEEQPAEEQNAGE